MDTAREVGSHGGTPTLSFFGAARAEMAGVDKLSLADNLKHRVLSLFGKQQWARVEKEGGQVRYVKVSVIAQSAELGENKIRQNLSRINQATSWTTLQEEIENRKAYKENKEEYKAKIKELQGFKELKKELNQRQIRKIVVYVNTKGKTESSKLQPGAAPKYIKHSASILPRTVEVLPGNEFVIHTNVKVGEGAFKVVKKTLTLEEDQKPKSTIRAVEKPHGKETPIAKRSRNTEIAVVTHSALKDVDELVTGKAFTVATGSKGKEQEKLEILMDNFDLGSVEGMQSKLTDPQMIMVARDMAKGTAVLHKNGIVHNDLKPANVLLKRMPDGKIKAGVADFGMAWFYGVNPKERKKELNYEPVGGSPAFLPPEYHLNRGMGPETDVWAMGSIMYCMWKKVDSPPVFSVTGRFSGFEAAQMRNQIEEEISKAKPGPMKEYLEIMLSAFTLDQGTRPSAIVIQTKLDALIAKYPNFFK